MIEQLEAELREAEAKVRVIRRKLISAQQTKVDRNAEAEREVVADVVPAGCESTAEVEVPGITMNRSEASVVPEVACQHRADREGGSGHDSAEGDQREQLSGQKTRVNRSTTVVAAPQRYGSQSKRPK